MNRSYDSGTTAGMSATKHSDSPLLCTQGRGVGGEGFRGTPMKTDPLLKDLSRELRRQSTPAEHILWPLLRGRRLGGLKFRRQQVVGPFILDFFRAETTIAVELDGETHLGNEDKDKTRQEWLEKQGIKVLRFWNTEVYDDQEAVLEMIWRECDARRKG